MRHRGHLSKGHPLHHSSPGCQGTASRIVLVLFLLVSALSPIAGAYGAENHRADTTPAEVLPVLFHASSLQATSVPGLDAPRTMSHVPASNRKNSEALKPVDLKVHFIDVGQGDCILLQSGGKNIMVDSGPSDAGSKVISYLRKMGVSTLDIVIATHPHEDHIGEMVDILSAFPVSRFIDSGAVCSSRTYMELVEKLRDDQTPYTQVKKGDIIPFASGITMKVLGPGSLTGDLNEDSIVLEVTDGEDRFLLTGDSTTWSEPARFLKVPHHGSLKASTFIRKVNPRVAVISAGAGNSYGHPAPETVNALRRSGVAMYRTDRDGTIVVTWDGKTWQVKKAGKSKVAPTVEKTPTLVPKPTIRPLYGFVSKPAVTKAPCDCKGPDLDCPDFQPGQGQACYDYCWKQGYKDIFRLDGNNDGQACEDD